MVNKDGYIELHTPGHPNAKKYTAYILEHRLVMEKALGRFLDKREVVHHRNGDKQDNRIDNLELFSSNGEHLEKTLVHPPALRRQIAESVRKVRSQRPSKKGGRW